MGQDILPQPRPLHPALGFSLALFALAVVAQHIAVLLGLGLLMVAIAVPVGDWRVDLAIVSAMCTWIGFAMNVVSKCRS